MTAIRSLQAEGVRVFALEQASASTAWTSGLQPLVSAGRWCWATRSAGAPRTSSVPWMACAEIPQFGVKHSLNVSVAAGMVCWQAFRSMGAPEDA